jgi:2-phosphosulfolactate phosphatase
MKLRVDLLPYGHYSDTVVVIDVLRATTTAGVYLENGASSVVFTSDIETALNMRGENVTLAGERGGLPIPDFDLGNSPLEASQQRFDHRVVVMNTTNGTLAAHIAAETGKHVLLASLRNAHAAARRAKALCSEEIAIVCAGGSAGGRAGVDDIYTAGVLCEYLMAMGDFTLDDGARIALMVRRGASDPLEFLSSSGAGQALERVGLGADINFCVQISQTTIVPILGERTEKTLSFAAAN